MDMERRQDSRFGLALAGGVIEGGFYEVGVLCALQEAVDGLDCARMDAYVGVSAGAVIASLLANGVSPGELSRAILSRAGPELNLNPDILFTPAFGEYARRVGRIPSTLLGMLRHRIERPLDLSLVGSLSELGRLAPVGLFDSTPMERFLARAFETGGRTNDFRELGTLLRIVAVKLDSAELVAFGDETTAHVPISKAVQASLSLPGLYCPVEIDDEFYIDGVARRTLNASLALDAGMDLLICVNPIVPVDLSTDESVNARSLIDHGLPTVLSQTFRTMIHSRMRTAFRAYEHTHPDTDIILIEPDLSDHRMFFSNIFSFRTRREVCEHAYSMTRRHLRENADEIAAKLARHGLELRHDVLADPTRTLFRPGPAPSRFGRVVDDAKATIRRLEQALERVGRAA
jgi:NTE family protein